MKNIKSCRHLLEVLKSEKSLRKLIIRGAPKKLIHALSEICLNTLNGNIPLSPVKLRKAHKYSSQLRKLSSRKFKGKKKILQRGGFLSFIIGTLLSALLPKLIG